MNEWYMIAYMALSGVLFAAGGTGQKVFRRYLKPCLNFGFLLLFGVNVWIALAISWLRMIAYHFGYGEKTSYEYKLLILLSYFLPSLLIGFTWWVILSPIAAIIGFWLSNFKPTEKDFKWKLWEFSVGVLESYCDMGAIK